MLLPGGVEMYTLQQYQWMERFENGAVWRWHADPAADDVIRFLMDDGLLSSREDLGPGVLSLTEKGRSVLEAKRQADAEKKDQAAARQAREAKRMKERLEDKAEQKREKKRDRIFQVFLLLLGFVLGVLAEHWAGVTTWVHSLFQS